MEILFILVLSAAAAAVVLHPIIERRRRGPADPEAAVDAEVDRYRRALRAGSLCDDCLQANPRGSRFCAECGAPLSPDADAAASAITGDQETEA